MPLEFIYPVKAKKADLSKILDDFQESLATWSQSYTTDIEIPLKNFKDLSRLQKYFPDNLPIYFLEGKYPQDSLTNKDLVEIITSDRRISLKAIFLGDRMPAFEVRLEFWNPHFRGFPYFKPDIDEEITTFEITPCGLSGTEGTDKDLLRTVYERFMKEFRLSTYEEFNSIGSSMEPETGVHASIHSIMRMKFEVPAQYDDIILDIFKEFVDFAKSPRNIRINLINTWQKISDFINKEKRFLIEGCGVDTTATGALGSIKKFNLKQAQNILKDIPKSSDVFIKLAQIQWKIPRQFDISSYIDFRVERRSLLYVFMLLLHDVEKESADFKEFTSELQKLTGLPFKTKRYWLIRGIRGNRYREFIKKIKAFYLEAYYLTKQLLQDYKVKTDFGKFRVCEYYEAKTGIFKKSKTKIAFKDTLIEFLKENLPEYKYDAESSVAQFGKVSFVRVDKRDLMNYVVFQRDPKWGMKIFTIEFQISKQKMSGYASVGDYSWYYRKDATDFLGEKSWWQYKSEADLIISLQNALDFINEAGDLFFDQVGTLLLKHASNP